MLSTWIIIILVLCYVLPLGYFMYVALRSAFDKEFATDYGVYTKADWLLVLIVSLLLVINLYVALRLLWDDLNLSAPLHKEKV